MNKQYSPLLWLYPLKIWSLLIIAMPFYPLVYANPIEVVADQVTFAPKDNQIRYQGNVALSYAGLMLNANSLNIFLANQSNKLSSANVRSVEAVGQPVKVSATDTSGNILQASANRIEYSPKQNTLFLKGDAMVEKDGALFRSQTIQYHLSTGTMTTIQNDSDDERVHFSLPIEKP